LSFVVQPKESLGTQAVDDLSKWLEKLWCQRILSAGITDLWLQITEKRTTTPTTGIHHLAVRMLSLGSFTSPGRYVCHWKSDWKNQNSADTTDANCVDYEDSEGTAGYVAYDGYDVAGLELSVTQSALVVHFEYDNDNIIISWQQWAAVQWRMVISFDSLADRAVLMKGDPRGNHLYLFIVNQPKLYRGVPCRRHFLQQPGKEDKEELFWERIVCFGSCSRRVIGASSAIQLEIDPLENDNTEGLLQRLIRHGFSVYAGNPEDVEANRNTAVEWPQFETFEATYAWFCLTTRGFKVTDQISRDFIDFVQGQEDEAVVSRLLYMIGDEFDNNLVVSLCSESLQHEWETLLRYRDTDDDNEDHQLEHLVKVRRILLTPTVVRALPAEHIVGNRVVREFGVDRFVRVVLRDEDMELLSASGTAVAKPVQVVTDFLRQDLVIGQRRYHFLGCSNSQMREHGFWMYASNGTHTVDSIRRWMGDLSHERCVATYVSRLGQFFSASRKAVTVEERFKRLIPDVKRNGFCFTDGVGMISRSLSQKVYIVCDDVLHLFEVLNTALQVIFFFFVSNLCRLYCACMNNRRVLLCIACCSLKNIGYTLRHRISQSMPKCIANILALYNYRPLYY